MDKIWDENQSEVIGCCGDVEKN